MRKPSPVLLLVFAVLFVVQGVLHATVVYPFWKKNYKPPNLTGGTALQADQFLFALVGLREFIAGILWVRADSFFETGNYDAILPVIRLVTWLDPKQIDVYATGMWHMAYNFTDEDQRSDRRYIKPALALGREGAANNDYTYELFHENGWIWYHKIEDDYGEAVKWFEEAQKREDMDLIPARKNLLTRSYERNGQLDKALDLFVKLRDAALKRYTSTTRPEYSDLTNLDTIEANLDNLLIRMTQRGWLAMQRADGSYEKGGYDTLQPFDVGFSAKVTVESPKVIRVEGTWNVLPLGSRIRIVLRDADYDYPARTAELIWGNATAVDLEPERLKTIMQDGLYVKNGRFSRRIDMSKDLTMYPFRSQNYIVEFFYNPRAAPEHLKDKFGFNGEGMTDKNYLNTQVRPGVRCIYAKLELSKDQILQEGEWSGRSAVVKTKNYKSAADLGGADEVVVLPSMRAGEKNRK